MIEGKIKKYSELSEYERGIYDVSVLIQDLKSETTDEESFCMGMNEGLHAAWEVCYNKLQHVNFPSILMSVKRGKNEKI